MFRSFIFNVIVDMVGFRFTIFCLYLLFLVPIFLFFFLPYFGLSIFLQSYFIFFGGLLAITCVCVHYVCLCIHICVSIREIHVHAHCVYLYVGNQTCYVGSSSASHICLCIIFRKPTSTHLQRVSVSHRLHSGHRPRRWAISGKGAE